MTFCSFCEKLAYTSKMMDDGSFKFYCSEHAYYIYEAGDEEI